VSILLRIIFFIVIGWYLIKWLARWISGAMGDAGRKVDGQSGDVYGSLTDQKIDDADYEDLSGDRADDT
jgi:hypothetical protein